MKKKYRWMLVGAMLSFIVPVGEWLVFQLIPQDLASPLILSYVYTEIIILLAFGFSGFLLGNYVEKIEKLAFTDPLTGVSSRHYLMSRLEELMTMSDRHGEGFCVIMFDLDHFKQVNDNYGHLVGDQTLKSFANCVMEHKRNIDIFGRYGGEEFILLCPRTEERDGLVLADRIRIEVEKLDKKALGFYGPQTVSAGVYEMLPGVKMSTEELLTLVDQTLYDAKLQGRNRVVAQKGMSS